MDANVDHRAACDVAVRQDHFDPLSPWSIRLPVNGHRPDGTLSDGEGLGPKQASRAVDLDDFEANVDLAVKASDVFHGGFDHGLVACGQAKAAVGDRRWRDVEFWPVILHRPCAIGAALSACIQQVHGIVAGEIAGFERHGDRQPLLEHARVDAGQVDGALHFQAKTDVYRGQELQRNTTVTELFSGAVVGHPPDQFQRGVIQSTFFFHQQGDLVGGGLKGSPWEG